MLFNSLPFLFVFLPVLLIVYYTVPARLRTWVLFISSLGFYSVSGLIPFVAFVITLSWSYVFGRVYADSRRSRHLALAISLPLLGLFLAKYLKFSLDSLGLGTDNQIVSVIITHFALPAGISFYTFQVVSYLADAILGRTKCDRDIGKYGAFVSFFPHFIAGPILRHEQIVHQLERIATAPRLRPDIRTGLKYIAVGLFYKTILSDTLHPLHERFTVQAAGGGLDALFCILSYAAIIYFDFWGYSLMAVGIAKLVDIDLPFNFLEPYKSRSPKDFWRRWHVTLSLWLRDYVYIGLGGNRHYVRNIIIVFAACGLWHGAGWNFVAWGLYHGLFVVLHHLTARWWDRLPGALQVAMTFTIVAAGWPLFNMGIEPWLDLLRLATSPTGPQGDSLYNPANWLWLAVIYGWIFLFREKEWLHGNRGILSSPWLQGAMLGVSILFLSFARTFIYFNF